MMTQVRIREISRLLTKLAAKRFTVLSWTQKTLDRAGQVLQNDV